MTSFNKAETMRQNRDEVDGLISKISIAMSVAFGGMETNRHNIEFGKATAKYALDATAFHLIQRATRDPSMVQPGETVTQEDVIRHARGTMIGDVERLRRACDDLLQFYKSF